MLRGGYNWDSAKSKCASEDPKSQLTSVRNQAENDFLKSQLEWLFKVDQQLGYIGVLNGGNDLSSLNNYEWLDHTRGKVCNRFLDNASYIMLCIII